MFDVFTRVGSRDPFVMGGENWGNNSADSLLQSWTQQRNPNTELSNTEN